MREIRISQRRAAFVSVVAILALLTTHLTASKASWNDTEWVSGGTDSEISVLDCTTADGRFAARGEGRVLGGHLLGRDLDSIAQASGMRITNDGERAAYSPTGAVPVVTEPDLSDDYANPLDVVALRALDLNLGGGILQLPLDNETGVISQYARASSTGHASGASGYITNSGGIALAPSGGHPEVATLRVSDLLEVINPDVAESLGDVTDVSIEVGAVAGRAEIDGCQGAWVDDAASTVTREYMAAALRTRVESQTIVVVSGITDTAVSGLQSAVSGLLTAGALNGMLTPLTSLLNDALGENALLSGVVRLKSPNGIVVAVDQASIDVSPLTTLLATPIRDSAGVLEINLRDGAITVDTAALLAEAYPGSYTDGLNSLAPNTEILVNSTVIDALHGSVTQALSAWVESVNQTFAAVIDRTAMKVNVEIGLELCAGLAPLCLGGWNDVGSLNATVTGTLSEMRDGAAPVVVDGTLLNGGLLGTLLSTLVSALTAPLLANLGQLVAEAADATLDSHRLLPSTADTALSTLVSVARGVFGELYGDRIVSLLVNAQNEPDTVPLPGPAPAELSVLPAGRFDVAALRVGILGALGEDNVHLYLGRGSVGVVCLVAKVDTACAGY